MNFFKKSHSKEPSEGLKILDNANDANSYLESGTSIRGEINSTGNLYFNSRLKGTLSNNSKLSIGGKAEVEGNVEGKVVYVEGYINGTLIVSDLLVLRATAKIEGEIITHKLIVEDGAVMNGNCTMHEQQNMKNLAIEQIA